MQIPKKHEGVNRGVNRKFFCFRRYILQKLQSYTAKSAYKESLLAAYFCNMDEHILKNHLRRLRESMGMTQEEFAAELGIDDSTYWRLEEGPTRLISQYLYQIAAYAKVTVADLVAGRNVKQILEESADMREKLDSQREYYEQKLAERDATIANLNRLIESLQK